MSTLFAFSDPVASTHSLVLTENFCILKRGFQNHIVIVCISQESKVSWALLALHGLLALLFGSLDDENKDTMTHGRPGCRYHLEVP
jgi:hypothetical protein